MFVKQPNQGKDRALPHIPSKGTPVGSISHSLTIHRRLQAKRTHLGKSRKMLRVVEPPCDIRDGFSVRAG